MLTLTCKNGELIKIGDKITIMVSTPNNTPVKISIDAPKEVDITRPETEKLTTY